MPINVCHTINRTSLAKIEFIPNLPANVVDIVVSGEITTSDKVEQRALCMEAEGMHRSSGVKEANRVLKAAMEKLKQREAELASLNERLKDLCRAKTGFFQGFL